MPRSLPLRQLSAIVVLPGTVTIVVPAVLHAGRASPLSPALRLPLGVAGGVVLLLGVALMASTIRLFTRVGEGTLAPWDPTRHLVVRGPYRHVRNPMISGVMAVLLGEAALLGTRAQLLWFLAFAVANALWIPLVEEPGLVRRFGDAWREYARSVPRWIPRLHPWEPNR